MLWLHGFRLNKQLIENSPDINLGILLIPILQNELDNQNEVSIEQQKLLANDLGIKIIHCLDKTS
jgi:hypothetical protein